MTTESQELGLTSHPKNGDFDSIVSPSLYWGVRTHTDCLTQFCGTFIEIKQAQSKDTLGLRRTGTQWYWKPNHHKTSTRTDKQGLKHKAIFTNEG